MIEYENLSKVNQVFFREYQDTFNNILRAGWFILGPNVERFERDFARYIGTRYCIGLASGMDALFLSLRALNLESESEVIVPSNTYIATILAVINAGLTPVLVEPDIGTYNINPKLIEHQISGRTRAVLVVHLYGKPCDMDPIKQVCRDYNLRIVEDCAQSHGAKYKGLMTGSFGDLGAFSFYPTKNLGALGDGGAITTNNRDLYDTIKKLRNYGSTVKYHNDIVGYNSRLDELQAAFLLVKLKHLDKIVQHKRRLARLYMDLIDSRFVKPVTQPDVFDAYHIFNVRTPRRDELREYLLDKQINTEIHYPIPPFRQKAMSGILDQYSCPISEEIHRTTLSLPISYFHMEDEILQVCSAINNFE